MAQNRSIQHSNYVYSADINNKFRDIFGGNYIFKGFKVEPTTGLNIQISWGTDLENRLTIDGVLIEETTEVVDTMLLTDDATHYIYASYTHGAAAVCTYNNSTSAPSTTAINCLLATVVIPNGTSTITAGMITNEDPIKSLAEMSPDVIQLLADMVNAAQLDEANTWTQKQTFDGSVRIGKGEVLEQVQSDDSVDEILSADGIVHSAGYNDIAERFKPVEGKEFPVGTVCVMTEDGVSIRPSEKENEFGVVGVVSDTYGYILGDENKDWIALGLIGRVKVKVIGPVSIFDRLTTSSVPGTARRAGAFVPGTFIGKALGTANPQEEKVIDMLVMMT